MKERERTVEKIVKQIVIPPTWGLKNWPPDVFPYDGKRARHVLRIHQRELLEFKALTRIGRELVVLGAGFNAWLASNAKAVTEWTQTGVAANRREHAAKRFGGGAQRGPREHWKDAENNEAA